MKNGIKLNDQMHWYKDAIIYELHIKAFYDSNGDGIGDFGGLLEKLDYLQDLGVTVIWLLPFYPSPLKDDGYDIADYYAINDTYGTIDQFKLLLQEAHKRNLKVLTELVINHTSDQHPWFQRARLAPRNSQERNRYVWTDDPTLYKDVRIIFQDFETSNWTWDPVAQQYFWHRFFHHQPDLNFDSPWVQDEIFKIIDYWCAMGVDGFRLDAVPYLFEREGTNGENLPETHAFLKRLRAHIDEKFPGTVFLAEANMWPEDSAAYFGRGDECHMNYHFPVMPRMFMAVQREDRYPITDIFEQTPPIPENCQWAMFLRNHDELTLEMVTDEERDYMYKVYAKDPKARINLGIRHRLAPLMDNDRRKIELMNSLLFSMPGTPVIYYGDEIGMGDNFYLGDRNGVRTPMQWSPDRNAGFSSANPHSLFLPVIMDPEYNYEAVNVETQRRNTSSLFWFMKRIITMRKKHKAFGRGDMKFLHVENPKVLAFTRTWQNETLLIIVNLSKYAQPAEVDLSPFGGYVPVEIFSKNPFPFIKGHQPYFFTLGPHSFQWFELRLPNADSNKEHVVPKIELSSFADLLEGDALTELQTAVLPNYLRNTNWFFGKHRKIQSIEVASHATIELRLSNAVLLLLEVTYETGLPELYQLPLTFVKKPLVKIIEESYPQAILSYLNIDGDEGVLCDAYYTPELQHWLFQNLAGNAGIEFGSSSLQLTSSEGVQSFLGQEPLRPRIHYDDQNNTAIAFNGKFFLKMYRKVDTETNPDIELSKFLTEQGFANTPAFLGEITWTVDNSPISIGMLQIMVENHGDGRSFMMERLNNYVERILARGISTMEADPKSASVAEPLAFEELPEQLQILVGNTAAEQARLLGVRTAELHQALTSPVPDKNMATEPYSLHYQRSLYSSMQALVRETYENIERKTPVLPAQLQIELDKLEGRRTQILERLKNIYSKKLDVEKMRIHGNLNLRQFLLTGKDVAIHDFGGNPLHEYSERRLKRSPLRDVASMIQSFYYVSHLSFLTGGQVPKEQVEELLPFASIWAHYISGFFLKAYLQTMGASPLLPDTKEDLHVMMQTFLLEGALQHLNHDLKNTPDIISASVSLIEKILDQKAAV
jgi:maltose alpha-D-glucosyltransferase/alpha-amylase